MSTGLHRDQVALLIVDVQERLAAVMPEAHMQQLVRNVNILLEAAHRLGIPVVLSEQYPRGLGPTVDGLRAGLGRQSEVMRLEKVDFSVCQAEGFAAIQESLVDRTQWIVTGMETHICVYQSARDLRAAGWQVQVPVDAVVSRAKHNYRAGLELVKDSGAALSSTEAVVMDLLGRAQGDDFKAISRLIR